MDIRPLVIHHMDNPVMAVSVMPTVHFQVRQTPQDLVCLQLCLAQVQGKPHLLKMLIRLHLPFELFDFCTVTSPFPLDPLEAKMEKIWFNVQRLVVTGSDTSQAIMRPTEVCPVARGLTSQKVDRKMALNLSLWGKKSIPPFSFRSNPYYYRVLPLSFQSSSPFPI